MSDITQPCMYCVVGMYEDCENLEPIAEDSETGWYLPCITKFEDGVYQAIPGPKGNGGLKDPSDIGDPLSTGRKRAAMVMPIMTGMSCQWANLKWAGGGVQPIVGCRGNTLAEFKKNDDKPEGIDSRGERHHGPDKAVLNNSPGLNLHGICSSCHHRWHEANDPAYETKRGDAHLQWLPSEPYYAHDPFTKAEEYDHVLSEEWWAEKPRDRGTFPIDLPDEERLYFPAEQGILNNESDNPFEEPLDPFTENGES